MYTKYQFIIVQEMLLLTNAKIIINNYVTRKINSRCPPKK